MKNLLPFLIICIFSINNLHAQCLELFDIATTPAYCLPADDGTAFINPIDGVAPFNFVWTGGMETAPAPYTITGLSPGIYTITVTDATGCSTDEHTFEITAEIPMTISTFDFQMCEGDCFTSSVDVQGGCVAYTYVWYDGTGNVISTNAEEVICFAGSYSVEVTDCYGCTEISAFTVNIVPPLQLNTSVVSPSAPGTCDGSIDLTVTGGEPPYFYQWSPSGSTTEDLIGICGGTYTVFVSDILGCTSEFFVVVPQGNLELSAAIEHPACADECFSEIAISVNGGTAPYTYVWSNGQNQAIIDNPCPGIYSVTVVDSNGAIGVLDTEVLVLNPLIFETTTTPASCDQGGTLTVNVLEGSGSYNYFINGLEITSNTATNLPVGDVLIQVTDLASSCSTEQIATIGDPYNVAISATNTSCDMADGMATVNVPGGTSTYTYEWSNGSTQQTATDLAIGGYSVTVTDTANGCQSHENIIIEEEEGCYVTISGYVIADENLDCISDMESDSIPNFLISLDETEYTFTDADGFYSFNTTPGNHTIYIESENIFYDPLCIAPIDVSLPNFGDISESNNFYVDENDMTDLRLYIHKSTIRPGFNHYVYANTFNSGNEILNTTVTLIHDETQVYVGSTPIASSYDPTTRTITWENNIMDPFEYFTYIAEFTTPATTLLGTIIEVNGMVDPLAGDINPDNNAATCTTVVVGSYDPNDKAVTYPMVGWETDTFEPGILDQMTYRIRFQNTGTDTAFTVVVEDELDALIDIRDVIPGPASHPYTLDMRDGNVLQFTFDNILLPDSTTNEAASHGFVYFDINISDDIVEGDDIANQAAIFFDYNAPIITNDVLTTFETPVGIEESELLTDILIQPNPATSTTTLFYTLQNSGPVSIDILDISGKKTQSVLTNYIQPTGSQQVAINTTELHNGIYFVRLIKDKEIFTQKLVII